jgi:pimeloyl-ACP methyl ester carboxylesterase
VKCFGIKGRLKTVLISMAVLFGLLILFRASIERFLLFFPTHDRSDGGLKRWEIDGEYDGLARSVESPRNVWLLLHGNAGQAADRTYALPSFSDADSVFILEYPGYGMRRGVPSQKSFDAAAKQAYLDLRKRFPNTPVCVAGESIGSGPGCSLTTLDPPPDKLVLIVPFDSTIAVAREHFPQPLVWLLLQQKWDNVAALRDYKGRIDIFAATNDLIIPPRHAKALADSITNSNFKMIDGGHNDWSLDRVNIRNP